MARLVLGDKVKRAYESNLVGAALFRRSTKKEGGPKASLLAGLVAESGVSRRSST